MVLKVLIADDDPAAAAYLKKTIEEVPEVEVVSTANDGKETIRQVEIHQPDVVFLDIDMPEMNGLEAARELAEIQPDTYFVFATAFPFFAPQLPRGLFRKC
ncbi:MAG: response regulator [Syntrophaceticus schinkii]